jgi:hypothetical protein
MATLTCPSPQTVTPLLGSGNYVFSLVKFPEITFFVQEVELPDISLGTLIQSSSVHDIPIPGESMTYGELTCTFQIDSEMKNYLAIHEWIVGLGYPTGHQLYKNLMANSKNANSFSELAKGYTDGTLSIMDNAYKPIIQARFVDCFPVRLSGIQFNSTNSDSAPLTSQVTFEYTYYELLTNL